MAGYSAFEAVPGNTFIHKMDIRTKILILLCLTIITMLLDSSLSLFVLFGMTLSFHLLAGESFARWRMLMILILLGIWSSVSTQALFYSQEPKTMLACLVLPSTPIIGRLTDGIYIYKEGIEYGAIQALRGSIVLALGLLLSWTSDPRQLLKSLLFWKIPYQIAFMIITGLRFLPIVFSETLIVLTAQRLRGFEPLKTIHTLQAASQTLLPILARSLRRAEILAASIESRGFGRDTHRVQSEPWAIGEKYSSYTLLVFALALVILKIMNAFQLAGIIYIPAWRSMYDLLTIWL